MSITARQLPYCSFSSRRGLLQVVCALVRPIVARSGQPRTLTAALVVAVVAMLMFGLASQGWMMYGVTALYGLLNPAVQGLMSRSVAANAQGLCCRAR